MGSRSRLRKDDGWLLRLSPAAKDYFMKKGCSVKLFATPKALKVWNKAKGNKTIGLFHVTC
jgi:hypothetical protein